MKRLSWLLACVALAGCSAAGGEAPSPSPTPSVSVSPSPTSSPSESSSPSPSPSPTMTLELSTEQQAALEAVQEYNRLVDEARNDPEMDLLPLAVLFANPKVAKQTHYWLHKDREAGVRQVGAIVYEVEEVGEVVDAAGVRSIAVVVCADSTGSDLVDPAGESVLPPDRTGYVSMHFDVVFQDERWRINALATYEESTC